MELRVRDRTHRVELVRDGADWLVTIGQRTRRVTMARDGVTWTLLIADDFEDAFAPRRSYDVMFDRAGGGELLVHVDGTAVPVSLPLRPTAHAGRARRSSGRGGANHVVAPMPGRVVSVLVEPGDEVAERQAVVVLEAMKMQNEVRAARAGVVTAVRVRSGATVEAGAVLVVIGDARAADGS